MGFDLPTLVSSAWRHAGPYFDAVASYPYHNRGHTEDVLRRCMALCDSLGTEAREREEIAVAAIFHDTGYTGSYRRNEPIGAGFARDFLSGAGWDDARIGRVESLILATALGSDAPTRAHAVMQDGDLDVLGREDGVGSTFALYQEMVLFSDSPDSWLDWLEESARLFRTHEFITPLARAERTDQQRENLAILERIIERERRALRTLGNG